jgi:hypothetical protein
MWVSIVVGFLGELVVAAAILWELEETRRVNFISESASKQMYEERAEIYETFMAVPGNAAAKAEALHQLIRTDPKIKKACDRQILLFETLGGLARNTIFHRKQFISVFPHSVIAFWVMLQPYIKERERRTGPWWAQNFREFMVKCIGFILEQKEPRVRIHNASRDESEDLIIDASELRLLRSRIRETFTPSMPD